MVLPLTWVVIAGTLPGVFLGYYLRVLYLPDPKPFKFFVGLVLLCLGIRLLYDIIPKKKGGVKTGKEVSTLRNHFSPPS